MSSPLIYFYTDFGLNGPYLGQMQALLRKQNTTMHYVNLVSDVPPGNCVAGGYLLKALSAYIAAGDIVLAVVDPGVGGARRALMVNADGRWYLGPDNGLLAPLCRAARQLTVWNLDAQQFGVLSASFHGRDLFAPAASHLFKGSVPAGERLSYTDMIGADWEPELHEIIYVDHFGNAMTGLVADCNQGFNAITIAGQRIDRAHTFSSVARGAAFCYENSIGLIEIAVNGANACEVMGLSIGDPVTPLFK